jgi:hypothetical protein
MSFGSRFEYPKRAGVFIVVANLLVSIITIIFVCKSHTDIGVYSLMFVNSGFQKFCCFSRRLQWSQSPSNSDAQSLFAHPILQHVILRNTPSTEARKELIKGNSRKDAENCHTAEN